MQTKLSHHKQVLFLLVPVFTIVFRVSPFERKLLTCFFHMSSTYSNFETIQIVIHNNKLIAKFAIMHLVVTNLSLWFLTIVNETEVQYSTFYSNQSQPIFEADLGFCRSFIKSSLNCRSSKRFSY